VAVYFGQPNCGASVVLAANVLQQIKQVFCRQTKLFMLLPKVATGCNLYLYAALSFPTVIRFMGKNKRKINQLKLNNNKHS